MKSIAVSIGGSKNEQDRSRQTRSYDNFQGTFVDKVEGDPLINSVAKAVGEVIEENNKRILEDHTDDSRKAVSNL